MNGRGIDMVMKYKTYMSYEAALSLRSNESKDLPVLTCHEKEVPELIAAGLTNQEIADKLFISNTNVETHRKNLLQKFEVRNVAALVSKAAKGGYT